MQNRLDPPNLAAARAAAFVLALTAASFATARPGHAQEGAGETGAPCWQTLRVGEITLDRRQVFDVTDPEVRKIPYTWVNALHFDTADDVILREMLVGMGEPVNDDLLRETERNLRALGYLRNVSIEKVSRECGVVDLVVHFQETWTLEPQVNLSGGGGETRGSAGLLDRNVLGWGKLAKVFYRQDMDRSSVDVTYDDPRLLGSRWDVLGNYSDRSDGRRILGQLDHPFFSLETSMAGGGFGRSENDLARIFENGDEIHAYERDTVDSSVWAGVRLNSPPPGSPVNRLLASYSYARTEFTHDGLAPNDAGSVPEDRLFSTLWLGLQRVVPDYIVRDHLDRFDRQEDFNLGNELTGWVGFSPVVLGSRRDTWQLSFSDAIGFRWDDEHLLFLSGRLTGRLAADGIENAVQKATLQYYYTGLPRQTLSFFAFEQYGWNLDADKQFLLGGENGLRGYPVRFLEGDKRILLSAEDRIFVWENILDLVSLGLALFADTGTAAHAGSGFAFREFKSDVGVGLRIGIPIGAVAEVIRLDFAYALNGNDGRADRFLISFGRGQSQDTIIAEP